MLFKQSRQLAVVIAIVLLSGYRKTTPAPGGIIAYAREEKEIRIIQPDGTGDRQFWTHPDAKPYAGLFELAWSPDGKELAFSSAHASVASIYHADIYSIRRDGTGFRKLTNAPDRNEYSKYPKGKVAVTVRNYSYTAGGVFFIYVAGADVPQQVTIPVGTAKTLTFSSVADFGNKAQAIVAIWGNYRWYIGGTDVQANKTVKAPDFSISGQGIEYFGAFDPVWRSDGSELSYRTGICTVQRIPSNPPAGLIHAPLFTGKPPSGACSWDWGPTNTMVNQFIYTSNDGESAIFLITEGAQHPGTMLTTYTNIPYQHVQDLHWLPDGSGLLYATPNLMKDASNIFRYDIKTKKTSQVTRLENAFARAFSISPDGEWIVYEHAKELDPNKPSDLWIQRMNGSEAKLLVKNATNPSWGK